MCNVLCYTNVLPIDRVLNNTHSSCLLLITKLGTEGGGLDGARKIVELLFDSIQLQLPFLLRQEERASESDVIPSIIL